MDVSYSQNIKIPKYLLILASIFFTSYLASPIVQNRLVAFSHTYFSATLFVYPLSYSILDIVTEVYGYRVSRQLVWCGIFAWLFSGLFFLWVTHLPGPSFWGKYDKAFDYVLHPYLRSVLSGSTAVLLGQFINIYIISKWKVIVQGRYFWLRSVGSSFIGNAITIILALLFIYLGRMPFQQLLNIIIFEVVADIIYCAIAAVPATIVVGILKAKEKIDVYDSHINFNPFKLSINQTDFKAD
jgi:queuosine precursor transporter